MNQTEDHPVVEARDRRLRRPEGMTEAHGHGNERGCMEILRRRAYEYWMKKLDDISRRG